MKSKTLIRSLLVVTTLAVVVAPVAVKLADDPESVLPDISIEMNEAEAAGSGAEEFGQLEFDYFTNGKTQIRIIKGNNVLFYAVLTSAETTLLRGVYGDVRTADGGQTAGTNDAKDGTATLPQHPIYGDLTD